MDLKPGDRVLVMGIAKSQEDYDSRPCSLIYEDEFGEQEVKFEARKVCEQV